jgi:glutathione S-transferase
MGCGGSDTKEEKAPQVEVKADAAKAPGALTMTYFAGLRSRGEVVQMCAAHGEVKHEMKFLTFEEWMPFKGEQEKMEPKGMTTLPFVTKPDGKNMGETCDVLKYLAELGGKFVVDEATHKLAERANSNEFMICDPVLNLPEEMRPGKVTKEDAIKAYTDQLKTLATELGDKNFFAGEKPGYGECFVFHNIDNCLTLADKELTEAIGEESMKPLKAFHKRFSELSGIKEYLAGRPKAFGFPGTLGNPAPAADAKPAAEADAKPAAEADAK